jgi:hypothetical protein
MMAGDEAPNGLFRHIDGKDNKGRSHQALRAPLRVARRRPPTGEAPKQHKPGEALDERVRSEAD